MTKYYVSNEATNGYIVGDDTNDGLTKQTAWLTADKGLVSGLGDGNEVMFNDGTYPYTANAGKITVQFPSFQITFENDYKTIIEFNGTSLQGILFNGSDTEDRELYIGRCYFTYVGTGFTLPVYISQSAVGADVIFRSGVRHVPQLGRNDHYFMKHQIYQGLIDIFDGGVCATDGGLLDLGTQTMGALFPYNNTVGKANHDIRVKSWFFNVRASIINASGPLFFSYITPPSSGTVEVGGVHGTFINTATSGDGAIAKLRSCPSGSKILPTKGSLTLVNENFNAFMTAANIQAPVADQSGAAVCDNALITGWKNVRMFCDQGFTAVMGSEGSDNNMANSQITDCEFDCYVTDPVNAKIHGMTHTNTGLGGGARAGNICNGAAIASLTKNSNAVSYDNVYARTVKTGLYGKGALEGALFSNETFVIGDDSISCEVCLKDGTNFGTGCDFEDTKIIAPLGGSFSPTSNVTVIGSSSDTSIGKTKRLRLSSKIVTGNEFGQYYSDQSGVDVDTWNETAVDPKVKFLESQKIDLKVKGITAITENLKYELLDSKYALVFKGDGLSLNASGEASINTEGLGFNIGDTIYYRISDHNFETNAVSNIGAGKVVVEAG